MKTKFRVFTALLLALMVLVSVLPLQAAAEIGQSGTATRAEAENTTFLLSCQAFFACDPCGGGKHCRSRTFGKAHAYPFLHSVGVLSQRQVLYSALQCFAYGQPAHRPCECCAQPAWVS